MAWRYEQSSGQLFNDAGELVAIGYSGHGEGLNNPEFQNVPDVGPLPQGLWQIGPPYNSEKHGLYVLPLSAAPETETFGRDEFKVHGDEVDHPGQFLASLGCLILPRFARVYMWTLGDHLLEVAA